MKIVRLTTENIKRLKAVEVTPTGTLVVIGGKNDAGKSSLLDAIEMAMGGEARTPPQPIRRGEKAAKVVLDLGDLVVTRKYTSAGSRSLVLANKEGARFPSPQAMLDKLYGALSFDPLAFERMVPKEQAETLRRLVGLDLSDLDKAREDLYGERTLKNRDVKALQVTADAVEAFPDVPAEEVSIEAVSKEMLQAEQYRRLAAEAEREVDKVRDRINATGTEIDRSRAEIKRLGIALDNEKRKLDGFKDEAEDLERDLDARQITAQAAAAVVPDVEAIRVRLAAAEGINVKVRSNRQHAEAVRMLQDAKGDAEALTSKIESLDAQRGARLAGTAFPVEGLSLGDEGVLLGGLPFEQASTSDRIRVSVAIGLASNPKLRVLLVRDGSLLGAEKVQILAEMAEKADAQVWLEMLQEEPDGRTSVFIEDGSARV